jgi:hypothetical protein
MFIAIGAKLAFNSRYCINNHCREFLPIMAANLIMKKTLISFSIVAYLVFLSGNGFADSDTVAVKNPITSNPANQATNGHATPAKGKPLEPAIRDAVRGLVNTSHEGLVEEKTDKGVEMKLRGRFRTAPVATINEKGEVTVRDYTAPPVE